MLKSKVGDQPILCETIGTVTTNTVNMGIRPYFVVLLIMVVAAIASVMGMSFIYDDRARWAARVGLRNVLRRIVTALQALGPTKLKVCSSLARLPSTVLLLHLP